MKKKLLCCVALLLLVMAFAGCGKDYSTQFTEVNQLEGVTLEVKEDALKSTNGVFLLTNDTEEEIQYRNLYHLEEKEDGNWVEFPGTASATWGEETTAVAAGETAELEINWKTLCGGIGSGEYRMIILVNDMPVAAEFTR